MNVIAISLEEREKSQRDPVQRHFVAPRQTGLLAIAVLLFLREPLESKERSMRNTILFLVSGFLITLGWTNKSAAQWVQSGPYGYGCSINAFAVYGDNVFAAGHNGIFASINDGTNWKGIVNGPQYACQALVAFSNATGSINLLAACGLSLLFSADGGAGWQVWDNGLEDLVVYSIAVSFDGNGVTNVFAGCSGAVFLSTDNGANWKEIDSDLREKCHYVDAVAVSGLNLYAGTDNGVFVFANSGTNWTQVGPGLPSRAVKALAVSRKNLFAGTDSGVYLSTDNGTSWTEADSGMANKTVSAFTILGNDLIAGTDSSGIFRSTDSGMTWTAINAGLINLSVYTLTASGTHIFAGTGRGVYVSTDSGASWKESNAGITNGQVNALTSIGTNLFAGTTNGVYRSTGESAGWDSLSLGGNITTIAASSTGLFTGRMLSDGAFLSTDDGTNWIEIDSSLVTRPTRNEIMAFAFSETNIFAGTNYQGIFLSTNEGRVWTPVNSGLSLVWWVGDIVVSGSDIFAGTDAGVFRSTNSGASWILTGFASPTNVNALAFAGTDLFAGTYYGAFLSTDSGADWIAVDSGLAGVDVHDLAVYGRNIFAGTDSGVFVTCDRGTHWTDINAGLPARSAYGIATNTSVLALLVSGSDLVAGTMTHGVWKRPLSEVAGVEKKNDEVPDRFSLRQNYPNPFNPSTTISYQLPVSSHAALKVFDVLGREVEILVNERQNAGSHLVTFDASTLASGVYFYRLEAGTHNATKKLLLLK